MNNLNQKLNKIEQDKRRILSNYQKERHLELLKRSEELKSISINESEARKLLIRIISEIRFEFEILRRKLNLSPPALLLRLNLFKKQKS